MLDSIFTALSSFLSGTNSVISFILFITIASIYLFAILVVKIGPKFKLLNRFYEELEDLAEDTDSLTLSITYVIIIITSITTIFFAYATYNSGQDYFSPAVRYILSAILFVYNIAAIFIFFESYKHTKDKEKIKCNTLNLLLTPVYCIAVGISLNIIMKYKYIVIGIIIFTYFIILYNVKFRPDSKIASLNDRILGLILPKQIAQKHIKKYFANKESSIVHKLEIEAMLKRKSIKLSTQDIEEILNKLENSGYIIKNSSGAWMYADSNYD